MEGLVATWTIISFAFLFDYFSTLRIRLKRVFSLALVETCFQLWALLTSLGWWEEKVEMRGKVPTSLWLTLWSWTSSFRITWVLVINAECFLPPHPPAPTHTLNLWPRSPGGSYLPEVWEALGHFTFYVFFRIAVKSGGCWWFLVEKFMFTLRPLHAPFFGRVYIITPLDFRLPLCVVLDLC